MDGTQLEISFKADKPLRKNNGQYCTVEQLNQDVHDRQVLATITQYRMNEAIWKTLRRMAERIIELENEKNNTHVTTTVLQRTAV